MQGVCAIAFEKDRAFFSFAGLKKSCLSFFEEKEVSLLEEKDFAAKLKANSEIIEEAISKFEKKKSLSIDRIFIELPSNLFQEKQVKETVVLSKKKKLTPSDIDFGKKYIEDKFLKWDEFCLHHIVLNYQLEEKSSSQVPLGALTNKIELNSLLIFIKESFYQDIDQIFYNLERNFSGFVAHKLALLSQGFSLPKKNQVVINITNLGTSAVAVDNLGQIRGKEFSFSMEKIIDQLAKQYLVTPTLAAELLERYGTFKAIPYSQEVSIKKGESYLSLSIRALGEFLKKIFSEGITRVLESFLLTVSLDRDEIAVSFAGPVVVREGFWGYIKSFLGYQVSVPVCRSGSSSFGCLRYGCFRPLEEGHKKNLSWFGKLKKVYREYF